MTITAISSATKCLTIVAAILRKCSSEQIFIARTGGEEFAVIVEGSQATEVQQIAESLRMILEQTPCGMTRPA